MAYLPAQIPVTFLAQLLSSKEELSLQALGPFPFLRDALNSYPFVPLVSYLWNSTFLFNLGTGSKPDSLKCPSEGYR